MIGIIGYGNIGKAIAARYKEVVINSPHYKKSIPLEQMLQCSAIFICVPVSRSVGISIIEPILKKLNDLAYSGLTVIKSSIPPDLIIYIEKNTELKLVNLPTFVRKDFVEFDTKNPTMILLGCDENYREKLVDIILHQSDINFKVEDILYCTPTEASLYKCIYSAHIAVKIAINNEYCDIIKSLGVNWNVLGNILEKHQEINSIHWTVPGPDWMVEYQKRTKINQIYKLTDIAKNKNIPTPILDAVVERNKKEIQT